MIQFLLDELCSPGLTWQTYSTYLYLTSTAEQFHESETWACPQLHRCDALARPDPASQTLYKPGPALICETPEYKPVPPLHPSSLPGQTAAHPHALTGRHKPSGAMLVSLPLPDSSSSVFSQETPGPSRSSRAPAELCRYPHTCSQRLNGALPLCSSRALTRRIQFYLHVPNVHSSLKHAPLSGPSSRDCSQPRLCRPHLPAPTTPPS